MLELGMGENDVFSRLKVRRWDGGNAFDDRELATYGWSIQDAIKFSLDHLRRQASSVSVSDAATALISAKKVTGRSDRYCNDLLLRLNRLAATFEGKTLAQISTANLETFLSDLNLAPQTRNTFRRDIRTLWGFAEKRGWASVATAKNTERAKNVDQPPGILTPSQAKALLDASRDKELVAFNALGLFAGLRVAEIKRLQWKDIDLESGLIHIGATVSKTRSRRLVPILDNLRTWLADCLPENGAGKVITKELRNLHETARRAAGFGPSGDETNEEKKAGIKLVPWPENALRHSFVSYRLAKTQNAAQTALESGHDQSVLFAHYRELVKPVDAHRFWELSFKE